MDPDADVREAEIARYSVGDDAVCAFPMFFAMQTGSIWHLFLLVLRDMIRCCRIPCLRYFALGISRMWLTFVVMRTNRGTPRASADLFSSHDLQFVSPIPSRHGNPCYSADLVCVV